MKIERPLRGARVLSVYLDGTADDFSAQRAWRVQLENSLKNLRTWLVDSSHAEREQFERCVLLLEELLSSLPVWSTGASVAPHIRALRQMRRVVVAVADSRKATLYCCELYLTHAFIEDLPPMLSMRCAARWISMHLLKRSRERPPASSTARAAWRRGFGTGCRAPRLLR